MRILDERNNELTEEELDLTLGYLVDDEIFITHHNAEPEQELIEEPDLDNPVKEFENGGKIVNMITIQEYRPAIDAWDEYETIKRYKLYTEDELATHAQMAKSQQFLKEGNDRLTEVESANLDQDELLVDIADTVTQNQLDTDEALTTLYELMTGETNE